MKSPTDPEPTNNAKPRKKYAAFAKKNNQYTPGLEKAERYNPFSAGSRRSKWTPAASMTPAGMSIVSPSSSAQSASPLDLTPREPYVSPGRRRLFERRTTPSEQSELTDRSNETPEIRDQAELLQLREKNTRTESQLRVLHERFHHIQKGLGSIDQERATLVGKAEKLEKEKKEIQRQLELRDKEILALVKRCASQEERMRESSRLRAENRDLTNRLDSAKKKTRRFHEEEESIMLLRKQLQDSELAREELHDRLAKVQREHDTIADTLQECLANISRLTEEKKEIEDERRREKKRSQIELEKQRLEHIQVANCLKDDIENKRSRIQQMENILQANMLSNTSLRREKAILSDDQAQEVKEVVDKYEKELAELKQQITDTERAKDEECESKLKNLRSEIQEMETVMKELESEFSRQMQDLMVKQSSLDEAEEEKKSLEDQIETIGRVEHEHSALLDIVGIMDSSLAELTTENAHLALEKDALLEEVDEMKKKTKELQCQIKRMQDSRKAREDDFRDLLQAEKEEYSAELACALNETKAEVEALKVELESRNRWILKLEEEIRDARRGVLQKEDEIREMHHGHNLEKSSLKLSLSEAQDEISKLEEDLANRDRCLASTEGRLTTIRSIQSEEKKRIKRLEEERQQLLFQRSELSKRATQMSRSESDSREESTRENKSTVNGETRDPADGADSKNVEATVRRLEGDVAMAKETERGLRNEISSLTTHHESLLGELANTKHSLDERDDAIRALEETQRHNDARRNELEEKLKEVTSDLRRHQSELRLLQRTNASLEIEAEFGRKSINEEPLRDHAEAKLQNDIAGLKSKVEGFKTEIAELSDRCLHLESEVQNGKEIVSEREKRIHELERDHQDIIASKTSVEAALTTANEHIQDLQSQLQKKNVVFLEKELRAAQKELSVQEMRALSVEKEYSDTVMLQSRRENYNRQACTRIASLEEQVSESNSKLSDFDDKLRESNRIIFEKERRVEELEKQIEEHERQVSDLEKSIEETTKDVDSLQISLEAKEKLCSTLEEGKKADQESIKKLEIRIESMESTICEGDDKRMELEKQLSKHGQVVSALQSENDSIRQRAESLNDQLQESHKDLDSFEQRLQKADTKVAEKSLQYKELQGAQVENESEKSNLRAELGKREAKISALNDKIASMAENSTFLASELSETSASLEQEIESGAKKEREWVQQKETIQKENSKLLEQLSERDEELKVLEADLASKTQECDSLEKLSSDLSQKKELLESKEEALAAKCKLLEDELTASQEYMEEKTRSLQQKLEQLQVSLAETESKNDALKNDKDDMKSKLESATEEITLLDEELGKKNQKIDSLEREKIDKSEVEGALLESEKERLAVENKLGEASEEVKTLKGELEQRESKLSEVGLELKTANSSIKEKESLLSHALHKCNELETKLVDLNGLVELRECRLLKVDEELHAEGLKNSQKDSEIQSLESLQAALQSSLDKAHGEVTSLTELSESRRQKIVTLDEELLTARQSLTAKDLRIASIDKALGHERDSNQKHKEENDALNSQLLEAKTVTDANSKEIAEQRAQTVELQTNLQTTSEKLVSEQEHRLELEKRFEKSIKKLETTIALKDDEIRDLRLVELKDAEEAIDFLSEENASIQKEFNTYKAFTDKKVHDMEEEKKQSMVKADEAVEMADLASAEYEKTIELYKCHAQELKTSNQELVDKVSEQDGRLQERHSTIVSLTQKHSTLEVEQRKLQCECDKLQKAEAKGAKEIEKLKMALDVGLRLEREEADIKLRKSSMAHRKELSSVQTSLREASEQLVESQKMLEERSALLSEMVEYNKTLESKLEKLQVELRAMKDESVKNKKEMDTNKKYLSEVRSKLRETEKAWTSKFDAEFNRRESAEKSLAKLNVQYNEAVKSKKLLADMEEENEQLKDKICRQEAYLQRKLQKEKKTRTGTTPRKAVPPSQLKTPKRRPLGSKATYSLRTPSPTRSVATTQSQASGGGQDLVLDVE